MKKINENKAITLIALIITIIMLLILAGISIVTLTSNGLFEKAKEAEQKSENAQTLENDILDDYESQITEYMGDTVIDTVIDSSITDDWKTWVAIARLNTKSFSDLDNVINNENAADRILNSEEAIDYMVKSTNIILPSVMKNQMFMTKVADSAIAMEKICESAEARNILYENAAYTEDILANSTNAITIMGNSSRTTQGSVIYQGTDAGGIIFNKRAFVLEVWMDSDLVGANDYLQYHGYYINGEDHVLSMIPTGTHTPVNKFASSVRASLNVPSYTWNSTAKYFPIDD